MEDMNVRANEVEEIETDTEVEETSDSSNAGALLGGIVGGIVGGFIAYAFIEGAKKLRVIAVEKWQAKKLKEANATLVEAEKPDLQETQTEFTVEEIEE